MTTIQQRRGTAAAWTSANPTLAAGEPGFETDTGKFKIGDGATAWTSLAYQGSTGLADHGVFTYLDATGAAAPGTPASGKARIYAKTDGRIYSKNDAGTEFGPFDAAGGGLYVVDDTFPGTSLPAGYAFTGSGSVAVAGGVAKITGAAQNDRLMKALTPVGQYLVKAHVQNVTGGGGMPSLCVLNSSGTGYGIGPYNDGQLYDWAVTAYAYNGTGSGKTFSAFTDYWVEIMIADGRLMGTAHSIDGTTWVSHQHATTQYTMTQFGIVQIFTSANIYVELAEVQICEP